MQWFPLRDETLILFFSFVHFLSFFTHWLFFHPLVFPLLSFYDFSFAQGISPFTIFFNSILSLFLTYSFFTLIIMYVKVCLSCSHFFKDFIIHFPFLYYHTYGAFLSIPLETYQENTSPLFTKACTNETLLQKKQPFLLIFNCNKIDIWIKYISPHSTTLSYQKTKS